MISISTESSWLQEQLRAQNENGLRHDDYSRYRKFAAKRVARLSKELKLSFGTQKEFKGKKLKDTERASWEYINYVLWESEKAWAFAMESKAAENPQHAAKRFKRSAEYAKDALELSEHLLAQKVDISFENINKINNNTYKQVMYHYCFVDGTRLFEKGEWQKALQRFLCCKLLLGSIADVTDLKLVFKARMEQLSPFIRYCRYRLPPDQHFSFVDEIDIKAGGKLGSEIVLRDNAEIISNMKLLTLMEQIGVTNDYETLLALYSEASQVALQELSADSDASPVSFAYFSFLKIKISLIREFQLAQELAVNLGSESVLTRFPNASDAKKEEMQQSNNLQITRVFENMVQLVDELKNLVVLKDDPAFQIDMEVYRGLFSSLKCLYLSEHYNSIGHKKESTELLNRSFTYAEECSSKIPLAGMMDSVELKTKVNLPQALDIVKAFVLERNTQTMLKISCSNYEQAPLMAPLCLESVPNKPIFFDLAYHYFIDNASTNDAQSGNEKGLMGNIINSLFGK